ncbi:glycosyltransferase family 4 protein [Chloroflexota bacterium]
MISETHRTIHVWGIFGLYTPNFSGAAIQTQQIQSRLIHQGFEFNVLTAANYAAKALAGKKREIDGACIWYLPVVTSRDWDFLSSLSFIYKLIRFINQFLNGLSFAIQSAKVIRRWGKRGDIVIIYSPNVFSFLIEGVAKKRGLHPVVRMTLFGSDDPGSARWPFKAYTLRAFKQSEAIISISSALTDSCLSAGIPAEKIHQISNGVDLQQFSPSRRGEKVSLREDLKIRNGRCFIVFVGSAKYRKGIDVLVHSFIQVAKKIDDVGLLIVGPCDFSDHSRHPPRRKQLVERLREDIEQSKLASRVHWIGQVNNVSKYLRAGDIFCFPTRREGLGTAVAEAMATGLPVIASRLEGITTDYIHSHKVGILIEGHDPDDYAHALVRLFEDPTEMQKIGAAAHQCIKNQFNLETTVRQYAELYSQLGKDRHAQ